MALAPRLLVVDSSINARLRLVLIHGSMLQYAALDSRGDIGRLDVVVMRRISGETELPGHFCPGLQQQG
jgi:hypothetical protein